MEYMAQMDDRRWELHFAFFRAASDGNVDGVGDMLAQGVSPEFVFEDECMETPLHEALFCGHHDVVSLLLQAYREAGECSVTTADGGPVDSYLDSESELGTPLNIAIEAGDREMTKLLLREGAHPYAAGLDGRTAFHVAVQANDLPTLALLLKWLEEAVESEEAEPDAVDVAPDLDERTALHMACEGGRLAIVRRLLQADADPNARTLDGETPLMLAAMNGHTRLVRPLVAAGAEVDGAEDRSPLGAAAVAGDLRMAKLLVEVGAFMDTPCWGARPLEWAKRARAADVVRYLTRLEAHGGSCVKKTRRGARR